MTRKVGKPGLRLLTKDCIPALHTGPIHLHLSDIAHLKYQIYFSAVTSEQRGKTRYCKYPPEKTDFLN